MFSLQQTGGPGSSQLSIREARAPFSTSPTSPTSPWAEKVALKGPPPVVLSIHAAAPLFAFFLFSWWAPRPLLRPLLPRSVCAALLGTATGHRLYSRLQSNLFTLGVKEWRSQEGKTFTQGLAAYFRQMQTGAHGPLPLGRCSSQCGLGLGPERGREEGRDRRGRENREWGKSGYNITVV